MLRRPPRSTRTDTLFPYTTLFRSEPPLPTIVRAADGEPVQSYARERRVQLQYADYPPLLIRAYMAAEDRTFFQHHGLDYPGITSAIIPNLTPTGRPLGASPITQQVARSAESPVGNECGRTCISRWAPLPLTKKKN